MAHRHLARSVVIQTLFSFDFFDHAKTSQPSALVHYTLRQFHKTNGNENVEFMVGLVEGVLKKQTIIDEVLVKAAPEWPLDKINAVDRNILRLGLYELLFGDYEQVPPKVAINEAIELAKAFGSDSSSRFVNGVLGAVYKEIGEPGKDQMSRRQKMQIPYEEMPIHQKAGAVVYAFGEEGLYFAMVHDVFGYWTLSKGSVEEGETPGETSVREVKEEIGLDIEVKEQIGENEYVAFHPEDGPIRKQVKYFLAESQYVPFKLEDTDGGLDDARWFSAAEVVDLTMYDDVTGLIAKSVGMLLKK